MDNVNGDGIKHYTLSLSTNDSTFEVEAVAEFQHDNEWVKTGETITFELPIRNITTEKTIPGFSFTPILIGLLAVILLRKFYN